MFHILVGCNSNLFFCSAPNWLLFLQTHLETMTSDESMIAPLFVNSPRNCIAYHNTLIFVFIPNIERGQQVIFQASPLAVKLACIQRVACSEVVFRVAGE